MLNVKVEQTNKELLERAFRGWNLFYRISLIQKVRNRACLRVILAREKELLSQPFAAWKKYMLWKQRTQLIVSNFQAGQNLRTCQKILFAFQRNVRLMMRKNFIKLEQEKAMLEANTKHSEKLIDQLDNEKSDVLSKQREGKKFITELNKKIEQQNQEIVYLSYIIIEGIII